MKEASISAKAIKNFSFDIPEPEEEEEEEEEGTEEEVITLSVSSFEGALNISNTLNLAELDGGYYKLFVEIEGNIYWDNIYKASEDKDYVAFFNLWGKDLSLGLNLK